MHTVRALLVCWIALVATAEEKPNFSGTWKLDLSRSVQMPRRLTGLTIVIEHVEPRIKMKYTYYRGAESEDLLDDGETNGKESVSRRGDRVTRGSMRWAGTSLLAASVCTEDGTTYSSEDKFTLSENERVLTIYEHFTEPGRERNREFVLVKQ